MVCLKIIIRGRVQGVFFRAYVKKAADHLGLKGYVKNVGFDAVEAVFQGEELNVRKMIELCKKGPDLAKVKNVKIEEKMVKSQFKDFSIIY